MTKAKMTRISQDLDSLLEELQKDLQNNTGLKVSKVNASSFLAKNFKLKIPKSI